MDALVIVAVLDGGGVHGQCRYDVTDVVPSPSCGLFLLDVSAVDLNNENHVVGWASCVGGNRRGFIWRGDGPIEFRDNTSSISAINDEGTFVGTIDDNPPPETPVRAGFSETADGDVRFFGTLPRGDYSEANDIAPNGTIVGVWGHTLGENQVPPIASFISWPDGSTVSLAEELGCCPLANFVNSTGRVVGLNLGASPRYVFVWDNGKTTEVDVPNGANSLGPRGLNEHGDYLLEAITDNPSENFSILVHDDADVIIDPVDDYSGIVARDLNNVRQVVGVLRDQVLPSTPFLWQHGQSFRLSQLVDLPEDTLIGIPRAINDRGVILGQRSTQSGFFLLTPRDVPFADVDIDCIVGLEDLIYLIEQWGTANTNADIDENGRVGFSDLITLLRNWGRHSG